MQDLIVIVIYVCNIFFKKAIIQQMNRVILSVLSQKGNLKKQQVVQLSQLCQPRPLQSCWRSQRFAIFPFYITFYLSNPPFNKISLSLPISLRTRIQIFGSIAGRDYFKLQQISQDDDFDDYPDGGIVSKFFKQSQHYNYLRFKFYKPRESKKLDRICTQVGLRGVEVANVVFFNCKYLCSLRKRLQLNPNIFRVLELLQYKTKIIDKQQPTRHTQQLREKYIKRIRQIEDLIYANKLDRIHPDKVTLDKFSIEFQQLIHEPVLEPEELDFSNPIEIKGKIKQLQGSLAQFYVDRLMNLEQNVTHYFQKYWNQQIRDIYLRYLSSPDDEDKTKALVQYWSEIKSLAQIPPNIEQATLMFFNYYLQFINNDTIKTGALKTMSLFLKFQNIGIKLYHVYGRIFFNLLRCLQFNQQDQLYKLAYKGIFLIYSKIPNTVFVRELMNKETHESMVMKLRKVDIMERIVINDEKFGIDQQHDKQLLIDFLLDVLMMKQLNVKQKNSVYNIIAFLAVSFGKEKVMKKFQQLNSMLLMNMEKVIDKKMAKLKPNMHEPVNVNQNNRTMCDYCGVNSPQFQDENIYDIHCYKQCKMLVSCEYCNCIIEIPELFKHYLEDCSLKNKFKNCDYCNDVIFIDKEDEHKKKCTKKLATKCPLCGQKLQSKLRIKQHVLKDGCPNNPRDAK